MSIFKFIEHLRKQPERKKQGVVLAAAFSITFIIAVFWMVALVMKIQRGGFSFNVSDADRGRIGASVETLKSSWDTFMGNISNIQNEMASSSAAIVSTSTTASSSSEGNIQ